LQLCQKFRHERATNESLVDELIAIYRKADVQNFTFYTATKEIAVWHLATRAEIAKELQK